MMHITQLSVLRSYRSQLDRFRNDMAELARDARISASDDMYTGQLRLSEVYFSETMSLASARLQSFIDQVEQALTTDLSLPTSKNSISSSLVKVAETKVSELSRNVSANFGLEQCLECAEKFSFELRKYGIHGQILELQTLGGRGFITMKDAHFVLPFISPQNAAISSNGRHFGVQVGDYVYDNIFRDGIPLSEWIEQFECDVGIFKCTSRNEF